MSEVVNKQNTEGTIDQNVPQVKTETPAVTQKTGVTVAIDEEADKVDSYGGDCQNCINHGKSTELNSNGTCPSCGFDKSKLYGAF